MDWVARSIGFFHVPDMTGKLAIVTGECSALALGTLSQRMGMGMSA
jgi:hypothetical protein